MRIFSQGGALDINYDNVVLEVIGGTVVYAHDINGTTWPLAKYSTPEQTDNEMIRLHAMYLRTKNISGKTGLTVHEILPRVFRFEPDETEKEPE